ncbi:unnamed protein product [Darwinula stevensoni]|uniref:G-protein coupled receptors family 1 profile domain-containing protein n=1 Tax=Darwinula stevensoni TaxID=69355 RepID=A0A7R9AEE4_9CRUS|nr:unnamed protein product [Darwinula stevensoni]CAG0901960.1 unnamed protein product [Darwinula stevensoni]
MGNLAVSYIVTGILVLPFSALIQFGGEWKFGHALCRIWVFLDKLCCGATVLSLCAISVDRYIGVSRPLAHGRIMSRSRTQWAIAFIWLISLAMSLGLLVGLEEKPAKINFCSVTIDSRYIIIRGIVNILIPSIVLLVLYWKVYRKAVSALRQGQDESDCESLRINRGETSTTSVGRGSSADTNQCFESGIDPAAHPFTIHETRINSVACTFKNKSFDFMHFQHRQCSNFRKKSRR